MASANEFSGIPRIVSRLEALAEISHADAERLGNRFVDIMTEDNRKGILQGQDKDGNPAPPLKYRGGAGTKTRSRSRAKDVFGATQGSFKGINQGTVGLRAYGNLTTREYQELTGPRLAPRGEQSRSIANYGQADPVAFNGQTLTVTMGWAEVLSIKGIPFLQFHFEGKGQAKYDLRGIRPWGQTEVRKSVREWANYLLTGELPPWGDF